jgi:prolipoprotein diacylglyceryltransferase
MSFPVWIEIFGLKLHPHVVFELLAYSTGFQLYLRLRARWKLPAVLTLEQNLQLIAGCLFGAWAGSKILDVLNAPQLYWAYRHNFTFLLSGKTLVGGLLGGWIGVELVKKSLGISFATGDVYVFPILTGIAIGRWAAFLLDWKMAPAVLPLPCLSAWISAMALRVILPSFMKFSLRWHWAYFFFGVCASPTPMGGFSAP